MYNRPSVQDWPNYHNLQRKKNSHNIQNGVLYTSSTCQHAWMDRERWRCSCCNQYSTWKNKLHIRFYTQNFSVFWISRNRNSQRLTGWNKPLIKAKQWEFITSCIDDRRKYIKILKESTTLYIELLVVCITILLLMCWLVMRFHYFWENLFVVGHTDITMPFNKIEKKNHWSQTQAIMVKFCLFAPKNKCFLLQCYISGKSTQKQWRQQTFPECTSALRQRLCSAS